MTITTIARRPSLVEGFAGVLDRVRAGAVQREASRTLLHSEIAELQQLGFGAARLPTELGGTGATLEQLFAHIIDLSVADASLGHVYRGHVAFVEGLLLEDALGESARLDRWAPRIARGDFIGNAQSERQETGALGTRLERDGDRVLLTGTKYYTTGSIYADWIQLAALDGDERVGVVVSTTDPGVTSVDDWDGFGQLLTGSGTTTFDRVHVDPTDIAPQQPDAPARWHYLGSVFQLSLIAVVAGIAQRALDDTVELVRPRRRTFGFAGETLPREDPLVQARVGQLSSAAHVARSLVLGAARDLDAALEAVRAGDDADLQHVLLDVYRLQHAIPSLVLDQLTALFEVGGASAVGRGHALDRHWRNVRTVASHNPTDQRLRALGQFELIGTLPEFSAPGAPARGDAR